MTVTIENTMAGHGMKVGGIVKVKGATEATQIGVMRIRGNLGIPDNLLEVPVIRDPRTT